MPVFGGSYRVEEGVTREGVECHFFLTTLFCRKMEPRQGRDIGRKLYLAKWPPHDCKYCLNLNLAIDDAEA